MHSITAITSCLVNVNIIFPKALARLKKAGFDPTVLAERFDVNLGSLRTT